jgi:probable HAF family extracellular repeat protein
MNKTTTHILGITLVGVMLTLIPARVNANAIAYSVTDLGTLVSGNASANSTYGINASGQVVGVYGLSDGQFNTDVDAVRWTGTSMTNLSNNGGGAAAAYGINDSGQVAGSWKTNFPGYQATVWTGTTPQNLGDFGGHFSTAYGINNSGKVVGSSVYFGGSPTRAFSWTAATGMVDLGTVGGNQSWAYGVNNSGQVAGASEFSPSSQRRYATRDGTALASFGGFDSAGFSINNFGQVAGYSDLPDNTRRAVRWTGTAAQDLGALGASDSYGYGINDSGDVVGNCIFPDTSKVGFFYTGGMMYDLNSLLLPGSGVTGLTVGVFGNSINNSGQIAAMGTINGQTHALRLDPVVTPEPASAALLLVGGALLGLRRRR